MGRLCLIVSPSHDVRFFSGWMTKVQPSTDLALAWLRRSLVAPGGKASKHPTIKRIRLLVGSAGNCYRLLHASFTLGFDKIVQRMLDTSYKIGTHAVWPSMKYKFWCRVPIVLLTIYMYIYCCLTFYCFFCWMDKLVYSVASF